MKILIFGGTGEARELANRLVELDHDVTSSLAGRTQAPLLPKGEIRSGGFGGVPQLSAYFAENDFERIIDATHPYAASMSQQLVSAADTAGVPLLRLNRPVWERPDGAVWIEVDNANAAIRDLPENATLFLSLGHKEIRNIDNWPEIKCLVRLIEKPTDPLPENAELLLARPPYTFENEIVLMREHGITHLLTKNSGGAQTRAKIDAAATLGITTYIVRRPELALAREVSNVDAAIDWVQEEAS